MPSDPPHVLKIAVVWLLLGAVVFLGVQWWLRSQRQTRFHVGSAGIELRRGPDGHYHWPGSVNGRAVDFLVDTGATGTAIPSALAAELQLPLGDDVSSSTAGGRVRGRESRADVALEGGVRVERLRITTLPALDAPLLGMDVMGRLRWQQHDGVLVIAPATP